LEIPAIVVEGKAEGFGGSDCPSCRARAQLLRGTPRSSCCHCQDILVCTVAIATGAIKLGSVSVVPINNAVVKLLQQEWEINHPDIQEANRAAPQVALAITTTLAVKEAEVLPEAPAPPMGILDKEALLEDKAAVSAIPIMGP